MSSTYKTPEVGRVLRLTKRQSVKVSRRTGGLVEAGEAWSYFGYFVCIGRPNHFRCAMGTASRAFEPVIPNEIDRALAGESRRRIGGILRGNPQASLRVGAGRAAKEIALPSAAVRFLFELLTHMGRGHAVAVVPIQSELTTQQAADLLSVSRPYLVGLLESKKLPFHKVGTHRRVLYKDVVAYKNTIDRKRAAMLGKLTRQAQRLGLGY
jgi:excisionase family DNA binding protein